MSAVSGCGTPCGTMRKLPQEIAQVIENKAEASCGTPLQNLRNLARKSLKSQRRRKRKQTTPTGCARAHAHARVAKTMPIEGIY